MPRKAKKETFEFDSNDDEKFSESYLSMGLGLLVVLVVGMLLFNFFTKGRNQASQDETQDEASQEQEGENIQTPDTHTVKNGETLWSISEKYYGSGFEWSKIAEENNLANPNAIETNQKLSLPKVKTVLPETGITDQQLTDKETYVVQENDSLWDIACKVYDDCYRWQEIAQINNIVYSDAIHTGFELQIPR